MQSSFIGVVFLTFACIRSAAFPATIEGRVTNTCPIEDFKCWNNYCIPFDQICDGVHNCPDGSDEVNTTCYNVNCSATQFACNDGNQPVCIPGAFVCDGSIDCTMGSDEMPFQTCLSGVTGIPSATPLPSCPNGMLQCDDNPQTCVPSKYVCDYYNDCIDGFDERNCTYPACDASTFTCATYNYCVPKSRVCDGVRDCRDGSDELPQNCYPSCAAGQFTCTNKRCISIRWFCDRDNDCGDLSDEPPTCGSADTTSRRPIQYIIHQSPSVSISGDSPTSGRPVQHQPTPSAPISGDSPTNGRPVQHQPTPSSPISGDSPTSGRPVQHQPSPSAPISGDSPTSSWPVQHQLTPSAPNSSRIGLDVVVLVVPIVLGPLLILTVVLLIRAVRSGRIKKLDFASFNHDDIAFIFPSSVADKKASGVFPVSFDGEQILT